jgi:alkanesulfonate monooxygenase SsuD/methylene tetrahydromethanopterin reductase-like flavin-dependent oxidoreductase (luciferase family)
MELGIYTFGDITPDPNTGRAIGVPQRYAEVLAAARLADDAGLDVFGVVGEHHRLDLSISSLAVIMAAIAGGTKRIRLTSAVTILSTLDPVRVFQDFASVDLLSNGRGELIAGRGAYIESFSLFGDDLADYDALFAEKLDLLLKLNNSERVTWQGRFCPPLSNSQISPRPMGKLPIWLGVGGNPESALRAGDLGSALDPCEHLPAAGQLRRPNRRLPAASHRKRTRRKHVEGRHSNACPFSGGFSDRPQRVLSALQCLFPRTRTASQPWRDFS